MRTVTDTELLKAAPHIAQSLSRSPCGETLEEVFLGVMKGEARLWLGDDSAALSRFVRTARITADEQIFAAGGGMDDLMDVLDKGAALAAQVGCHRLVIEDTRKGWAKVLKERGFEPVHNVLVRDL